MKEEIKEITEEERKVLDKLFSSMGAKPKVTTKGELAKWLSNLGVSQDSNRSAEVSSGQNQPSSASDPSNRPTTADGAQVPSATQQPIVISGRKPWLTKFAGEDGYEVWRHQLTSLRRENHRTEDIHDAIRASLQGKAAQLLVSLGESATIDVILSKLDSVFGVVDDKADVLASFYSAKQGSTETVADWSCRLEGLFARARRLMGDAIGGTDEALKQMFWTGLRQELKDISVYAYHNASTFDELRKDLRRIEKQHPPPAKPACKATQPSGNPPKEQESKLEAMVKQLSSELKAIKNDMATLKQQGSPHDQQQRSAMPHQPSQRGRGFQRPEGGRDRGEIYCYRCGEPGHVRVGCRTNISHVRRPQDFSNGPAARGGHRY